MRRFRKGLKHLAWILAALLAVVLVRYGSLVPYGIGQLKGQLEIVWNAIPVDVALKDTVLDDESHAMLLLSGEIRRFAFDSLGLIENDNYTTFYDQQGKTLLWVVTACAPFRLEPYQWHFPVIGNVSYKGFFEHGKALAAARDLEMQGYDTGIRPAGGWSTLGWFRDPILSGMYRHGAGDFTETLIHELTHGTVFLESSVDLNENLATFVGEAGAEMFLVQRFGSTSEAYTGYLHRRTDHDLFARHLLRGSRRLDSLYRSMDHSLPYREKARLKYGMIASILLDADTLPFHDPLKYRYDFSRGKLPHNTWFMSYLRYRGQQDAFRDTLDLKFHGNLPAFIAYYANLP